MDLLFVLVVVALIVLGGVRAWRNEVSRSAIERGGVLNGELAAPSKRWLGVGVAADSEG